MHTVKILWGFLNCMFIHVLTGVLLHSLRSDSPILLGTSTEVTIGVRKYFHDPNQWQYPRIILSKTDLAQFYMNNLLKPIEPKPNLDQTFSYIKNYLLIFLWCNNQYNGSQYSRNMVNRTSEKLRKWMEFIIIN